MTAKGSTLLDNSRTPQHKSRDLGDELLAVSGSTQCMATKKSDLVLIVGVVLRDGPYVK
jgi:hypothetical protein